MTGKDGPGDGCIGKPTSPESACSADRSMSACGRTDFTVRGFTEANFLDELGPNRRIQ